MSIERGSGDADVAFLVPVSDSSTLEETVGYAAREAREVAAETDGTVALYLVSAASTAGPRETASRESRERLLAESASVAEEAVSMTDPAGSVAVETVVVELERSPLDPVEYAESIAEFAADRGVDTVVVDPGHRFPSTTPIGRSLEEELRTVDAFDLEVAPVQRRAREGRLVTRGGLAQFLALAALSWGFYVVVGGLGEPLFDAVTGAAAAVLVAGVLSRITFERTPRPIRMVRTFGRWLLYVPYLLYKVVTANVQMAYVVLHPSLPIDPTVERFEPGVWGGTATATLANSITLTPGTLTVDVRNDEFVVHALTRSAHEDLLEGGLERAVRFVFYGRGALRYPSPRERLGYGEDDPSGGEALTDGGTDDPAADGGATPRADADPTSPADEGGRPGGERP